MSTLLKEKIESVPIDSLIIRDKNPNQMTEQEFSQLKYSIQNLDYIQPILVDQDNVIVDGAHRYQAFKELGATEIEVIRINVKDEKHRALISQALNKIKGRHAIGLDSQELDTLFGYDADVLRSLLGVDESHLEILRAKAEEERLALEGLLPGQSFGKEITTVLIKNLKSDEGNPNIMTDIQLKSLENSIRKFGVIEPIIIDQNNIIVDGEHRFRISEKVGRKTIPAIIVGIQNDNERRLLRQTLNKIRGQHDIHIDVADLLSLTDIYGIDEIAALTAQNVNGLKYLFEKHNIESKEKKEKNTELDTSNFGSYDAKCPECGHEFNLE